MTATNFRTAKMEQEKKHNDIITNNGVFWAFNQKQFDEGVKKLKKGDKLLNIGHGGYMPKSNYQKMEDELKTLKEEFRKIVLDNNFKNDEILYHLCNYESFYTNDLEDAYNILKEYYTIEDIRKVYYKNLNEYA